MGILPGIIGTIQATETIKVITKIGKPLNGRLLIFNALKMSFKELTLRTNPENKKIYKLMDYDEYCSSIESKNKVNSKTKSISIKDLKLLLSKQPNKISIIDVRSLKEYLEGSIPGSKLIPLYEINKNWKHPKLNVVISRLLLKIKPNNLRSIKVI